MEKKPTSEKTGRSAIARVFKQRQNPPSFILSVIITTFWMAVVVLAAAGLAGGGLVLGIAKAYVESTPKLDVAKIADQDETSFIYDRDGKLITAYSGAEYRVWASISEMPKYLTEAFVAIEDTRFLQHNGVDVKRIAGVFLRNLANDSMQGGSTITQQLIKNTLLTDEQTYRRKIQEAYLAMQLEAEYSKDQILEYYMNTITLGEGNYGVKTAALDYLGKDLDDLTLRECALIAGLARNPGKYSPRRNYVVKNTPEISDDRTAEVLKAMFNSGYIDQAQYDAALADKVSVVPESARQGMYDMPYFVEYAIQDVIRHFLLQRGLPDTKENRSALTTEIRKGGYRIYTTVDPVMQHIVEDTLHNWTYPALEDPNKATKRVQVGSTYIEIPQPQAAAAVVDYRTGELRAIVGGRDAPIAKNQLNRASQSAQPVGSSIKPLTVYGPALDLGLSPATPVGAIELPIEGWDHPRGYPTNFTSSASVPPLVSMRKAMYQSYNTSAARLLTFTVKVNNAVNYLTSMGVAPEHIRATPFGLSLGATGLTVIEEAACFGTIANSGQYVEPLSFTHVTDAHGAVLLDMRNIDRRAVRQVFQTSTAYMLTDMLVGAVNSGTGTAARIKGVTVGGKTGTNSDYKGTTFAGITPDFAAAVWIGHDDYEPALKSATTGGKAAAPLWQAFMAEIYKQKELENKPIYGGKPEDYGVVQATVCGVTGLLATDACAADVSGIKPVTDYFKAGTVPFGFCYAHQFVDTCLETNRPAGQYCPAAARGPVAQLFVTPETPLGFLPAEQAQLAFPLAIVGIEPSVFLATPPSDPLVTPYYCPVHTYAWSMGQPPVYIPSPDDDIIYDIPTHADPSAPQQGGVVGQ